MNEAQLQGASLSGALLQGASLDEAQLQGADLDSVNFEGASLDLADFTDVENLTLGQLDGACTDGSTWFSLDLMKQIYGVERGRLCWVEPFWDY